MVGHSCLHLLSSHIFDTHAQIYRVVTYFYTHARIYRVVTYLNTGLRFIE